MGGLPRAGYGRSKHALGSVWYPMIHRCYHPNNRYYSDYGGRGISVYQPWRDSFSIFASYIEETIGPRPEGKSLDRIDNDGNYCPGNLKWSTPAEQSRNTSRNRWITYEGRTLCLKDWSIKLGISQRTLRNRLGYGWTIEAVLGTPPRHHCPKLTMALVRQIRDEFSREDITQAELAEKYGVKPSVISRIINNTNYKEQ